MSLVAGMQRLTVVVGAGGVGKTTVSAALGLRAAESGRDTLVMTFDPSRRLKDAMGIGPVDAGTPGSLEVRLLDARETFDGLVERYAPDAETREAIFSNRYYRHLAGGLSGILEYMAVERLYEVASENPERQIVLDTPPTRQALDFLEAPQRIVGFLDSGALKLGMRRWFDGEGRFRPTAALGGLGRRLERLLDDIVGMDLLRDVTEFFQAFGPLYDGFRQRAAEVETLLRSDETGFILVAGPGEERNADTLFFARHLDAARYRLGPIVVNRMHPHPDAADDEVEPGDGAALVRELGRRDHAGFEALRDLVPAERRLIAVPLMEDAPAEIRGLQALGELLDDALGE